MATGSGIPQSQAIQTSEITPTYSVPSDNSISQALGKLGDINQGFVNQLVEKHYQDVGASDGAAVAAGTKSYQDVPVITDVGRARAAAFQTSYLAGIKTDIDSHVDQMAQDNQLDPDGFKAAADDAVSAYAKSAPGPYAVQVQQYAAAKAASAYQGISAQKVQSDQATAVNGVNARQQTLQDQMLSLAAAGQDDTTEFQAAHDEWSATETAKVANPLFHYAPEQAAMTAQKQVDAQQGAVLTHHATLAYNGAGGGEAGKEAALAMLKGEALDDGGALSNMAPDKRLKLYAVALSNITDLDKADAEARQIKTQTEALTKSNQRDKAGELALGLTDGSVDEAGVKAAESSGQIEDGAAARLIMGARAQQRREQSESNAAAATARSQSYQALSELAANGQLTPADLARQGGSLLPLQRLAISARINKSIGPGVANITGVAAAAYKDNGINGASAKIAQENLKVDAATFMQNNPNATVGQQQAFAADWVHKNKGLTVNTSMGTGSGVLQTRQQVQDAYRAKFRGQGVSEADVQAVGAKYAALHPNAH